jgi:hypothetical protein
MKSPLPLLCLALALLAAAARAETDAGEHRLTTRNGSFRIFAEGGLTQIDGDLQGRRFSSLDRGAPAWFERVGLEQVEGQSALRFAGPGASFLLLVHDLSADEMPEEQRKAWLELIPKMIQRVDGHYRIPTAVVYGSLQGTQLVGGFDERIPLR